MVRSMQLNHQSPQDSSLLVQVFPSRVILNMNCLAAVPVLVIVVDFGIHQLQRVDKVMKQIKVIF